MDYWSPSKSRKLAMDHRSPSKPRKLTNSQSKDGVFFLIYWITVSFFPTEFKASGWFTRKCVVLPHLGWKLIRANKTEKRNLNNMYDAERIVRLHDAMTAEETKNAVKM